MAKRFGLRQRLWRSAYSGDAYRDVAVDRVPSLIGYLAVLIVIATVVTTISTQIRTAAILEEAKPWLADNIPELRISDGKLSSPVDQPYIWESEDFGFVLDTTGDITELDPAYEQGVLLTETEVVYRQSRFETRRYDVSDFPDMVLDEDTWDRWIDTIKSWLWAGVAIASFLWLWVIKLLQVLFWSLIGLVVSMLTKRSLRYGALFNIGIYALTVPLAFDLLAGALGWLGGATGVLSLALYAGYLGWGIFVQPMAPATPSTQEAPST